MERQNGTLAEVRQELLEAIAEANSLIVDVRFKQKTFFCSTFVHVFLHVLIIFLNDFVKFCI